MHICWGGTVKCSLEILIQNQHHRVTGGKRIVCSALFLIGMDILRFQE